MVLTGAGPVWLYLKIAHALHGVARKLIYRSPVTGDVVIIILMINLFIACSRLFSD